MRGHANNFDALRLIAALAVLFSHMFALSGRVQPIVVGDDTFGSMGVLVFFSISGFLVAGSMQKDPDLGRFLAKRFLRLAPALAVAMPLTFFIMLAFDLEGFPGQPLKNLNGSLWTIPYEVYCYVILAGAWMVWPRVSVLLAALYCLVAYNTNLHGDAPLVRFGMFFTMGALLQAYPQLRTGRALIGWALAAAVAHHEIKLALALIVPPLTVYIGTRSWPVLRSAGRYGDLSYGVYIYAWPVQQFTVAWMGMESSYLALVIPTLAVTFALAWLSWRFVESPALDRKPKSSEAVSAELPRHDSHALNPLGGA
jgi:peptidoglycan/LPS O-acetylase OafA/YrhL